MTAEYERFLAQARSERGGFFDSARPITAAQAPGWVDLLGGAATYGGALALGWPLATTSMVAVQPDPEPTLRIRCGDAEYGLPMLALVANGVPHEYADAAAQIRAAAPAETAWWPYLLGAWVVLMREEFVHFAGGARVLFRPADGPGAPASWSAATMQALVSAYGVHLAPRELALGCQALAQRVVGSASDSLGPMLSVCGLASELLQLHPQPAWHWGNLHLPHGAAIWALRVGSGPTRATENQTRVASTMAYRLVADAAGMTLHQADARWQGYLSNIGTIAFARRYCELLPVRLAGADFLARYEQPPGARVLPEEQYPLRAAASLAIDSHLWARSAAALLRAAASKAQREEDLLLVGELMAQSHWAQRAAGLGDAHADRLADIIDAAGPAHGLFGARAPAAASGATLVVLGHSDAADELNAIATRYATLCGQQVMVFGGTAHGCNFAGTREV